MPSDSDTISTNPTVSVVLLNFNGARFGELWASVLDSSYPNVEVVFVDNGSSDESLQVFERLRTRFSSTRTTIVRLPHNVGYSEGNNIGYKSSNGEIVCLLSNDIKVDRGWIEPIVASFRLEPRVGAAQSTQYRLANPEELDAPSNVLDVFGFNHALEDPRDDVPVRDVFYTEGAVMFVRRRLVDELGYLFPSDYFMTFEDADFCWRARLRGWRSVVVRDSTVYHARGGTEPGRYFRRNPSLVSRATRNRLATMFTNLSCSDASLFIPLTIALESVKALGLAFHGRTKYARAVMNGAADFLGDMAALRTRRRTVQATRLVPERSIRAAMLDPVVALQRLMREWRPAIRDLDLQLLPGTDGGGKHRGVV